MKCEMATRGPNKQNFGTHLENIPITSHIEITAFRLSDF